MTSPDPSTWPDSPPPLPPTLPTGPPPGSGGWSGPPGSGPIPPGDASSSPPPAPPSPTRTGLIAAIVAVIVVLALAATFVAVRAASTDDVAAPTTTTPPTTERADPGPTTSAPDPDPTDPDPPGGSSTPDEVQAEVDEIATFVEEERGLEFTEPVEVTALGADEFKARVLEEFESDTESLETQAELLRAGGVVPADVDIVQSQLDLLGDGVLGFYDPITKELVVRSDSSGPMVRSVIAHELTHALDDQHFDLDRPELADRHDGSDWAFLALVEGSAKQVENAYLEQLSAADQEQLETDQLELALDQMESMFSTPLVLAQLLMSPYDYGAPFVQQLLAAGGSARVDEAYGRPPVSSEQVLDFTRFDGDVPIVVERPPAEGEVLDEGVLGELFTGFLLAESTGLDDMLGGIDPDQLDQMLEDLDLEDLQDMMDELEASGGAGDVGGTGESASGFPPVATTPGWGGDRYVLWETADEVCLRADWVMDTPEALTTFRGAVAAWAARDAAVVVSDPTPESVRVTRCAPEGTTAAP